ncbi:MAG: hypothetical protein V1915_01835 [Candidatus Bathyarchaeota archaeon]
MSSDVRLLTYSRRNNGVSLMDYGTVMEKEHSVIEGETVSAQQTQAGFAIGVRLKNCIQYFFSETYIRPGTNVKIKYPELTLLHQ